ncbi:MAG: hypothetical protein H6719_29525 [Sandaracinaceae bacterium]|nr:hypothetical protein [Sandaracinaceae bacterium]
MANYQVTSIEGDVVHVRGDAGVGTVAKPTLTGHFYASVDSVAQTTEGAATKSDRTWRVEQAPTSFEPGDGRVEPATVTVDYTSEQLGIPLTIDGKPHRDADEGTIYATDAWAARYWPWSATYDAGSSDITTGPEGATFTDMDGKSWSGLAERTGSAQRAVRFVDWRDRTPQLAADPQGQLTTASSVTLVDDTTYFRRGPARKGSGGAQDSSKFYCIAREGWLEEYTAGELGLVEPEPQEIVEDHHGIEVGFDEENFDTRIGVGGLEVGSVGKKQQLRIKVPNVFTQMTLGTAYSDGDAQGFAHLGFGVETGGHIFMSAGAPGKAGNEPNNRMKLQSHGDMTLYSATGGMNLGALGGMMLGTGGGLTLSADGGVLIAGGTAGACKGADDGFDQLTAGRNVPEIPKWINSANKVATVIGAALAGYDAYVGVRGVASPIKRKSALGLKDAPAPSVKASLAASGAGLFGAFASFAGAVSGSLSAFADYSTPTTIANVIAGTTIWGEMGWIGGTLLTMGLYSGAGTTISSMKGVAVLGEGIALDAKEDIELTGKSGKLAFDEGIEMITGNTLRLAARKGGVGISGATIGIGDLGAEGKQAETKELALLGQIVEVGALSAVNVSAAGSVTLEGRREASVTGGNVTIGAADVLSLGAGDAVIVGAKSGIHLSVGPSGVQVDKTGVLLTHKASEKSNDYAELKGHLDDLEKELSEINDQYKELKTRSVRQAGKVTGLGPIKNHLGKVEELRDAFRKEIKKTPKVVDKSAALHVKKGGVFFKFGSHTFKVTKQGFENASIKAAK